MRKVKILTDSCSDLNKDLMEKYDIDYAKMNTVYEGVTFSRAGGGDLACWIDGTDLEE